MFNLVFSLVKSHEISNSCIYFDGCYSSFKNVQTFQIMGSISTPASSVKLNNFLKFFKLKFSICKMGNAYLEMAV